MGVFRLALKPPCPHKALTSFAREGQVPPGQTSYQTPPFRTSWDRLLLKVLPHGQKGWWSLTNHGSQRPQCVLLKFLICRTDAVPKICINIC